MRRKSIGHRQKMLTGSASRNKRRFSSGICAALLAFATIEARGQDIKPTTAPSTEPSQSSAVAAAGPTKFKKMSLDELMNVEVTSVSRHESTIGQSAAAIDVISQDDIRRSGATNIPEALRQAPGMEVAQIDNSTWAISARGFNNNTANKLLVLMDGRSVYTPLYSGVFWDVQDTMMQDIDRIEVIRGPAGALWGANAVNGVVNVITKDAQDTQGLLVSGGGGTELRNFENVRYGWAINSTTDARIYVKHFERGDTPLTNGSDGNDTWMMDQTGFRIDSRPTPDEHLTLQGDAYQGSRDNLNDADTGVSGGNILGRWTQKMNGGGDMSLQTYTDITNRAIPLLYNENRGTFDVDFQHHIPVGDWNDVTWGLGYRISLDHVKDGIIQFVPNNRAEQLFSFFAQDEIPIVKDKLRLTVGAKLEHNDFTGFEFQPNGRLLWSIDKKQAAWTAVSRAVRTPTQLEDDLQIVAPGASLIGNKHFQSERVIAYEVGYRMQPTNWLSADVAAFYNDYHHLRSLEFRPPIFSEENQLQGQTYGVEVGSTVKPTDWWTLRGAYTFLHVRFQAEPGSTDTSSAATAGNDPQNQAYLRSSFDLCHNVEFDCSGRWVSELPNQQIPGYVSMDARLAWKPIDQLELSVVAQNLLDNQHPEFGTLPGRHEIQRSVYGMFTFRW